MFSLEDYFLLTIPPLLAYDVTPPAETILRQKKTINNKLQGSVGTYVLCDGFVSNQN